MIYGDGLVAVLIVGFWLFCLFDVIITDDSQMRNLSKGWWIIVVGLLSVAGSIMWLVAGRPHGSATGGGPAPKRFGGTLSMTPRAPARPGQAAAARTLAPDDDPQFLDQVRKQNAQDSELLRLWEEDLRRREDDLRGQDPPATEDPTGPAH